MPGWTTPDFIGGQEAPSTLSKPGPHEQPSPSPQSSVPCCPGRTPTQLQGLIQACGKSGAGRPCWPEKAHFTGMPPCTDAPLGSSSGGFDKLAKLQFSVA